MKVLDKHLNGKFRYKIENNQIVISTGRGLWEQLDNSYKTTYDISNFDLSTFTTVINGFLNKTTNEQTESKK